MTGLDKIIESISAEAQASADAILKEARQAAAAIVDEASAAAGAECAKIVEAAREEAELISKIAQSGSELNGRKLMLKTRREILDEAVSAALAKLKSLPDGEYFAVLSKLAVKYAQKGSGEILLSATDKARVPADFISNINSALHGGTLTLAQDTADTDGGLILRYGGIEENCTFDAIAQQERDAISDELSALLFS